MHQPPEWEGWLRRAGGKNNFPAFPVSEKRARTEKRGGFICKSLVLSSLQPRIKNFPRGAFPVSQKRAFRPKGGNLGVDDE
jgi:hypothetical protein